MRVLEIVQDGVLPLRLGMTPDDAEGALGPADERLRSWLQFDTMWWFGAALQADFDGDGRLGRIGVTWTPGRISARLGDLDLFRVPADDVVEQLSPALGAGERDTLGYEHCWPERTFSLWRIPPPADESAEFRGGRYWTAAFTWTTVFLREAEQRAAVRRVDAVG